jgi:hypothetical protein
MSQALAITDSLGDLRLPDLQAYYADVVGEPTRCPNKKYLIRRITEALEAQRAAEEQEQADQAAQDGDASAGGDPDTPLSKLTVDQLRARYVAVVGRPTGSTHRQYLIWKVRQAERGRIPIGPRPRRATGAAVDMKILPLRMPAAHVEQLDAARERLGLDNRMQLFREALSHYLEHRGEPEVAALFSAQRAKQGAPGASAEARS